jgi:APA family basic amino acid/polyamine antiporter
MALPARVPGGSLFGRTLETVLAARPCRVIIESTSNAETRDAHKRVLMEKASTAP